MEIDDETVTIGLRPIDRSMTTVRLDVMGWVPLGTPHCGMQSETSNQRKTKVSCSLRRDRVWAALLGAKVPDELEAAVGCEYRLGSQFTDTGSVLETHGSSVDLSKPVLPRLLTSSNLSKFFRFTSFSLVGVVLLSRRVHFGKTCQAISLGGLPNAPIRRKNPRCALLILAVMSSVWLGSFGYASTQRHSV